MERRSLLSAARARLRRIEPLRRLVATARLQATRVRATLEHAPFEELPPQDVVRLAHQVLLRREADPAAQSRLEDGLRRHELNAWDVVDQLRASDEYRCRTPIGAPSLTPSLHLSRCEFITSLPPARRIVDLGGSHLQNPWGALVLLGYPYDFDECVIVDLPPDERHALYHSTAWEAVDTPRGRVRYEYRSMTDLSFAPDGSVDLVYSGQSIEHVSRDDAMTVFKEVARVLRPGGFFALDTPNAAICRLQTPSFIDPDHEHEYVLSELTSALADAGLDVVETKGLNLASVSASRGTFEPGEVAANWGVYADAERCYLLALLARKPSVGAPAR